MNKKTKVSNCIKFILASVLMLMGAVALVYFMYEKQYYGSGNDMWGHIFKADYLYHCLLNGEKFPLFTPYWYNGEQMFRYWPPLSYYILAGLQYLAGGDINMAQYLFAGVSFFIGSIGWLLWGYREDRMELCTLIAFLWFFLPDNLKIYMCEGNLPRMTIAIIIPYMAFFVWSYIKYDHEVALLGVSACIILITFTHVMMAALTGIGWFLFLLFYSIGTKTWKKQIITIFMLGFSYVVCGIILLPSLSGGIVGMGGDSSSNEIMISISQSLLITFDPTLRAKGNAGEFYFGLAFLPLMIFGSTIAIRGKKSGYITSILLVLLTTKTGAKIISYMPLSSMLWMRRLSTLCFAFIFISFIEWKNLKRWVCILFMSLLVADTAVSIANFDHYYTNIDTSMEEEIRESKTITENRMALMDLSSLASSPSYIIYEDEPVMYTFGWAWQGATTAPNIQKVNSALEQHRYVYMFDRLLELGDDVVVFRKNIDELYPEDREDLLKAADLIGYDLYSETDRAYTFKYRTDYSTFGMISKYEGIALGKYAAQIAFGYPAFCEGSSSNLDDYSVDELAQYKVVLLTGVEYSKRAEAEEMIKALADRGTRVVIDMDHIQVNPVNKRKQFLDVIASDITFSHNYPEMTYKGELVQTNMFAEAYSDEWATSYLIGAPVELGKASYTGKDLTYLGTNEEGNIWFVSFNLFFHANETGDLNVYDILNDILDFDNYQIPERKIVPIQVNYNKRTITVESPCDNVNTTIAWQDIFRSEQYIDYNNYLLIVNSGKTVIEMDYPHLKIGLLASFIGVILVILLMLYVYDVVDYFGIIKEKNKKRRMNGR